MQRFNNNTELISKPNYLKPKHTVYSAVFFCCGRKCCCAVHERVTNTADDGIMNSRCTGWQVSTRLAQFRANANSAPKNAPQNASAAYRPARTASTAWTGPTCAPRWPRSPSTAWARPSACSTSGYASSLWDSSSWAPGCSRTTF